MRLAYVCAAGGAVGWGHLQRGVALLEQLDHTSELVVGRGFHEVVPANLGIPLREWLSLDEPIDRNEFDVVIVDDYSLSADWLAHAGERIPTFMVDDWMRSSVRVDGFINPNLGAAQSDYPDVEAKEWFLGSKFAFIRGEARELASAPREQHFSNHILVTMGGSDPDGRTAEIVDEFVSSDWFRRGGRLTVVLGASYSARVPLSPNHSKKFEMVRNPPDYLTRCRNADLVVCSASTISHEMALLGVPFVPVAFVDNQTRLVRHWQARGVGAGFDVANNGWAEAVANYAMKLLSSPLLLAETCARIVGLVDGLGTERVLRACRQLILARAR